MHGIWNYEHNGNCPFLAVLAGLCLMQLAVPKLRSSAGLLKFNAALEEADYDLTVWRTRAGLPAKETSLLDADDAAGWELAEALLRPRSIEVNEDSGTVKFVNTNKQAARLGVAQALEHRFMQQVSQLLPSFLLLQAWRSVHEWAPLYKPNACPQPQVQLKSKATSTLKLCTFTCGS